MLIYDFYNNQNDIVLMTRPKRFGKTLNLSMIEHFFDIQKPQSAKLFSEFEIAKKKDFCKEHQNKYPVINISLKKVKASNWNDCFESFKTVVSELYEKNDFLLNSDKLKYNKKTIYENIQIIGDVETHGRASLLDTAKKTDK